MANDLVLLNLHGRDRLEATRRKVITKKMTINIAVFSKLCYLQKKNFINLPSNSLTGNFVASM